MENKELYPTPEMFRDVELGEDIYGNKFSVGDVVVLPHQYIEGDITQLIGESTRYFVKQKIDNEKLIENRVTPDTVEPEPFFKPTLEPTKFYEEDKYVVSIYGVTPVLVPINSEYIDHKKLDSYSVVDVRTDKEYVGNKGVKFKDNPLTGMYAIRKL